MISPSCCPPRPHEQRRPDPPWRSRSPNSYTTSRDTTQLRLARDVAGSGPERFLPVSVIAILKGGNHYPAPLAGKPLDRLQTRPIVKPEATRAAGGRAPPSTALASARFMTGRTSGSGFGRLIALTAIMFSVGLRSATVSSTASGVRSSLPSATHARRHRERTPGRHHRRAARRVVG